MFQSALLPMEETSTGSVSSLFWPAEFSGSFPTEGGHGPDGDGCPHEEE